MTVERAIELLGGRVNGHDVLNAHDLLAGHAYRHGMTLVTAPRRGWSLYQRDQRQEQGERRARPGSRLIGTGGVLLFLLGSGLLAVSFAAQYQYVLRERQQHVASLIEAGALDVGLIIFSLLALGLARAGLSAKIERAGVVGCAVGSAVMNYAAADVTSPRSVLAYCMPPVFLAFVVDRVVRTIQRHVLGMSEGRSPWAVLGSAARRITRFWVLSVLYVLRFLVDRRNTCAGLKQAILNATPLPAAPPVKAISPPGASGPRRRFCFAPVEGGRERCGNGLPCRDHPVPGRDHKPGPPSRERGGTRTARFLDLVKERYGEFGGIDPARVSPICTELAAEAGIDPGNARTVLRRAVLAARDGEAR